MFLNLFNFLFKQNKNCEYKILKESGLFNEDWYKQTYLGDLSQRDAISHYLKKGRYLKYNPNNKFSSENYGLFYVDVSKEKVDPFLHYIKFGRTENRLENPINSNIKQQFDVVMDANIFDAVWYCETYKNIIFNGTNPLIHYLTEGWLQGLNPSANFSTFGYLMRNDDVYKKHVNPLVHYIKSGQKEGRQPLPQPFTLDVESMLNSGLFNQAWYINQYGDKLEKNAIALLHFLKTGWTLGFDPSKDFSTLGYLDNYRDVKAAKINPLMHYVKYGCKEGRKINPNPRGRKLTFPRITPEEYGKFGYLLQFDQPHQDVLNIENEKICIHVHLFYEIMLDDIIGYLKNICHKYQLLVSVREDANLLKIEQHFRANLKFLDNIIVRSMPNIGRDVAPWVVGFADEIKKSTIFCHLHTKRSLHNIAHNGWFRYLCHVTLGSVGVVDQILSHFINDPKLGVIAPFYHWTLADQPNYGKNYDVCCKLFSMLSKEKLSEKCMDYPAGSFFWVRTNVLKSLFDLHLTWNDFEEEQGQIDGTIAHGIERIIGFLPHLTGYELKQATVDIAYNLIRFFDQNRKTISDSIKICNDSILVSQKPVSKININKNKKIAIFTANIGSYDATMPIIFDAKNADVYIVVDSNKAPIIPGYKPIISNYINPIAVRTARFAKTHPHIFFPDYDYVFWIDSNVYFLGDCNNYIDILEEKSAEFGTILHNVRTNAIEECQILQSKKIVDMTISNRQMELYQQKLDLNKLPLFETNFFLCKPKSEAIQNFMNLWWAQINQFTHRDQLSVNYAARLANIKWVNLIDEGLSTRDHPDFLLFSHNNKDRLNIIQEVVKN